jgi:ABC-type sugar transport system ATPase subunit
MNMKSARMAIKMQNVTKAFTGTIAVNDVDFDASFGEVHAIVGENGAGKSTLMKILSGSFKDYQGDIFVDNEKVLLHSNSAALSQGIGMIYQELSLARPISIAENLLVGNLPLRMGFWMNKKELYRRATERLKQVGLDLDATLPVSNISQHEAQLIEIAKVLGNNPRIIVMDEPTSSLSRNEVDRLFHIIKRLRDQDFCIIYISHHLDEIFRIADRITVLRDGKRIATLKTEEITREELANLIVGKDKDLDESESKIDRHIRETVLSVEQFTRFGFFHDISFSVKKGEILGIAGLTGAGRSELLRSIVGIDPLDFGKIIYKGLGARFTSFSQAIQSGIVYLTEDRKTEGLFTGLELLENTVASVLPGLCRFGFFSHQKGSEVTTQIIRNLNIVPDDPSIRVLNLSGGNQQKVLLGKWLATKSKVFLLDEPTRGVDIGAKELIHREIVALAESGASIVLVSSDIPELARLCDRIVVMRAGKIVEEIPHEGIDEKKILLSITGKDGNS